MIEERKEFRDLLVNEIRYEMVGGRTIDERIVEQPHVRYSIGVLYPSNQMASEFYEESETVSGGGEFEEVEVQEVKLNGELESNDEVDAAVNMTNSLRPSAVGVSVMCTAEKLLIRVNASIYEKKASDTQDAKTFVWQRKVLDIEPLQITIDKNKKTYAISHCVYEGLDISYTVRLRPNGKYLISTVLVNRKKLITQEDRASAEDCFFQCGLSVESADKGNAYIFYPIQEGGELKQLDDESKSLDMLYRNRMSYGMGHGCAADWNDKNENRLTDKVWTEVLPSYDIPPVMPRESSHLKACDMYFISDAQIAKEDVLNALEEFSDQYGGWIETLKSQLPKVGSFFEKTADRHIQNCNITKKRMDAGIRILRLDQKAYEAFRLANTAMLMQQIHSSRPSRDLEDAWFDLPVEYKRERNRDWMGRWRDFQLAFILMNLPCLTPDAEGNFDENREIVDLIWFPTGGGKTEAYLGLSAYEIFRRKLKDPNDSGCNIFMRYTLRLLTTQQFQRAAALIVACEKLRSVYQDKLGVNEISIGLWVGSTSSPNKRKDAVAAVNAFEKPNKFSRRKPSSGRVENNPFQLLKCPCCGTRLDSLQNSGYRIVTDRAKTVKFLCPEARCDFNEKNLPVVVIDEDIYDKPPTLIIGTVDKFAMLAWEPKAKSIFSSSEGYKPSLIIQDELHLIAGPLGTAVGLFESVIDRLCTKNNVAPKVVGSTATIRNADMQVGRLYNKELFQFPPAGLDASDSYFSFEDERRVGRKYIGVLPASAPSVATAFRRVHGALLMATKYLPAANDEIRDPYWTSVQYFNSLRELGNALTLAQSDIREHMRNIASRRKIEQGLEDEQRFINSIEELTSRKTASEIPSILEKVEVGLNHETRKPIDILLSTSMISVGVDVERLGVMTVSGQPKTTSEYIQASSRVGRGRDVPGLVLTMYNPSKPRDRSHYEQFKMYHSALYRYVEPTSVTPFSIPNIDRALNALLIVITRVIAGWETPHNPNFNDELVKENIQAILNRCKDLDNAHYEYVEKAFESAMRYWTESNPSEWGTLGKESDRNQLMYPPNSDVSDGLGLKGWKIPTSMRSVDDEAQAYIPSIYPSDEAI